MRLVELTCKELDNKFVYINPDMVVSLKPRGELTVVYLANDWFVVQENIKTVKSRIEQC